jgi:polyvinyl alcohol dehydrogenase (cytochrome)
MTPANRPNRRKRRLWGPVTALAAAALVAPPAWASAPPAWGSAKATGAATLTAAVGAGARAVAGGEAAPVAASTQQAWPSAGQNNDDTRNAAAEHILNVGNVGQLAPKWTFTTAGDVSATATVAGGTAYVPDWDGKLWAVSAATGQALWSRTITSYDGIPGDVSRTSPAYYDGELVIGTGANTLRNLQSAYAVGIDARTGAMLWRTKVDANPATIVTSSPTVDDGVVYVGTSSRDEGLRTTPTFRGSVLALNARTGKVLWRTYTVPAGYTGGAVWGSQPVVDRQTGLLYVGTGNNYSSPPGVCASPGQPNCTPRDPADHMDSIMGMSLQTGKVKWSKATLSADNWTIPMPNDSPDFDFGAGPQLYTTTINGHPAQLLGIGQKSGVYWALNPATGKLIWQTQGGPGGSLGGIEWGTATDGTHVFINQGNSKHVLTTITSYDGTKTTTTGGFFEALSAATGAIDWQVADPQGQYLDDSFVSSANGVMYTGSAAATGPDMYALNGTTGQILWRYASGGAVWAGAAIVNGTVYWGTGYHTKYFGLGYNGDNNKLYAFTLNGH